MDFFQAQDANLVNLDFFENALIQRFREHRVLRRLPRFSRATFEEIALQRRELSHQFTHVVDLAICAAREEAGKVLLRQIVREEYPDPTGGTPGHREDLDEDLERIGISVARIKSNLPTSATSKHFSWSDRMVRLRPASDELDHLFQIRVFTMVRLWGEVLVSEEYKTYWPKLEELGLTPETSEFYYPHYTHDAKQYGFGDANLQDNPQTHADRLGAYLESLLMRAEDRKEAIAYCARISQQVVENKMRFYGQFSAISDE